MPYSVAAAGPFTISMDSMSSGSMSLIRDGPWLELWSLNPPTLSVVELDALSSRMPSR